MIQAAQYPMLVATLGILLFSMMDAVMKGQALAMGTYNAMFWRMAMGALIVALLYLPTRPARASCKVLRIHLIRAALTAVMAYLFFFGLTRIPWPRRLVCLLSHLSSHCSSLHPYWVSVSARTPDWLLYWDLAASWSSWGS